MWLLTLCNTLAIVIMVCAFKPSVTVKVSSPMVSQAQAHTSKRSLNGDAHPQPMVQHTHARHMSKPQGWHSIPELE